MYYIVASSTLYCYFCTSILQYTSDFTSVSKNTSMRETCLNAHT